jgi:hypothetical protein
VVRAADSCMRASRRLVRLSNRRMGRRMQRQKADQNLGDGDAGEALSKPTSPLTSIVDSSAHQHPTIYNLRGLCKLITYTQTLIFYTYFSRAKKRREFSLCSSIYCMYQISGDISTRGPRGGSFFFFFFWSFSFFLPSMIRLIFSRQIWKLIYISPQNQFLPSYLKQIPFFFFFYSTKRKGKSALWQVMRVSFLTTMYYEPKVPSICAFR